MFLKINNIVLLILLMSKYVNGIDNTNFIAKEMVELERKYKEGQNIIPISGFLIISEVISKHLMEYEKRIEILENKLKYFMEKEEINGLD